MSINLPGPSYWEQRSPAFKTDVCMIGGGFTSAWTAWFLSETFPEIRITIVDALINSRAASTRNAGFLCYGSPSEVLADIRTMGEQKAVALVGKRMKGLDLIRKIVPFDLAEIAFQGGREFFPPSLHGLWEKTQSQLNYLNELLEPELGFRPYVPGAADKSLREGKGIDIEREGSVNPAALLYFLNRELRKKGVQIIEGTKIKEIESKTDGVNLYTETGGVFQAKKVLVATNGFTPKLISGLPEIQPARNVVVVLKPSIPLQLSACYHTNEGYVYYRKVGQNLLIGGGRNWFREEEFTDSMEVRTEIVDKLMDFAKNELFHPKIDFKPLISWSGIMGVGNEKSPVFQWSDKNILVAARLSGMGVALSPLLGKKAAKALGKFFNE